MCIFTVPKYVLAVLLGWKFYTKYKYFLSIPLVSVVICHDLISEGKKERKKTSCMYVLANTLSIQLEELGNLIKVVSLVSLRI